VNRNGHYDAGTDTVLSGWRVYAYADNDSSGTLNLGDTLAASTTTTGSGQYSFDLDPGRYVILEEKRIGWTQTEPAAVVYNVFDPTRPPLAAKGYAITLTSGQADTDNNFGNRQIFVIGPGKSPNTPQVVKVIDEESGAVLSPPDFAPYGNTFQGGVRVATGDLNNDGVDEIVTAPGWSIVAEVRVYTQNGGLLTSFQPYGPSFKGGVQVAVADVDNDGWNDIITVPSWGPAEVKVFRNEHVGGAPTFDGLDPYRDFLAFPSSFIGGAVVAAADMGSTLLTNGRFDTTPAQQDHKAEIVVGSGAGIKTTVKVFDVSRMITLTPSAMATAVASFTPFSTTTTSYKGGVSLSVARINLDHIPDIVVGAGVNGGSLVDVWAWNNSSSATLSSLSANGIGFAAFDGASQTAPVQVAALDTNGDDIADAILAVQGPGGTTNQIREFNITSVSPWLVVSPPTAVPGSFPGPYFIATIKNPSPVLPLVGGVIAHSQGVGTIIDNDPPPNKFYVVNDGSSDRTYEYGASGTAAENYALSSANTAPRGAVSTAAGDKVWVVDANRKVYVYNTSGSRLGSWTAGTLASNATVEGIATNGTDIWIVDARSDKVFKYPNAASRLSGSQNAASRFNLNSGNTSPKDIVTDGTHLWVVNDAAQDKVFKYTLSGSLAGSWTITGGGGAPTGLTLDPAAPRHLWIVDKNTDRVYQYNNAVSRTSGSLAASTSFALAAGNTNPQGIADPPPRSRGAAKAVTQDTALLALLGELDWLTPAQHKRRR
jgi:hypothetical protein